MPFWFWSIFGEMYWELFFLDIKVTFSEKSTEKLRNLFFLPGLNKANSEKNLDLFKQLFLKKTLKGDKYKKKNFSPTKWAIYC